MTWREKHLELVKAVNAAKTEYDHRIADVRREGFLEAIRAVFDDATSGSAIIEADLHYLDQGIDRPMCGGVFLDWQPEVRS